VEFTVGPESNCSLGLTSLSFDVKRSVDKASAGEKGGPEKGLVEISYGSTTTSESFVLDGSLQTWLVDLPDILITSGEVATIRYSAWDAGHKHGWIDLDNITVGGSVTVIPEPNGFALLGSGLLVFMWARGGSRLNTR
jgi:hypothetical protein